MIRVLFSCCVCLFFLFPTLPIRSFLHQCPAGGNERGGIWKGKSQYKYQDGKGGEPDQLRGCKCFNVPKYSRRELDLNFEAGASIDTRPGPGRRSAHLLFTHPPTHHLQSLGSLHGTPRGPWRRGIQMGTGMLPPLCTSRYSGLGFSQSIHQYHTYRPTDIHVGALAARDGLDFQATLRLWGFYPYDGTPGWIRVL